MIPMPTHESRLPDHELALCVGEPDGCRCPCRECRGARQIEKIDGQKPIQAIEPERNALAEAFDAADALRKEADSIKEDRPKKSEDVRLLASFYAIKFSTAKHILIRHSWDLDLAMDHLDESRPTSTEVGIASMQQYADQFARRSADGTLDPEELSSGA